MYVTCLFQHAIAHTTTYLFMTLALEPFIAWKILVVGGKEHDGPP